MKRFFTACIVAILVLIALPASFAAASDIDGHWAESSLRMLIDKGIMAGYGKEEYRPNNPITRAEFATLMIKMLNQIPTEEPIVTIEDIPEFTDLDKSKWYYGSIMEAAKLGIIQGADGKALANNQIKRQEMAAMIIRALNTRGVQSTPVKLNFADNDAIPNWAKEDIQRVVFLEIMNGRTKNNFEPDKTASRAEVATVLVRMMNKLTNDDQKLQYTHYNYTIEEMINLQMSASHAPQTDLYGNQAGYLSGDYIVDVYEDEDGKTYGYINTAVLRVRQGPGTDTAIIGRYNSSADNPTKVLLQDEVINDKGELWYQISYGRWADAKREDVAYYVNPNNFQAGTKEFFQFLVLSKRAGITADELNNKILQGKGILEGQGEAFIQASMEHNINEIYLVSHALLETGLGFSNLAQGIEVDFLVERDSNTNAPILDENGNVKGQEVEKKKVYNFYGIGAVDVCPDECGSERAYKEGWFTPEAAIIGGAKYIAERYIHHPEHKQDTLYKMRWNPDRPATHQYATDIGWAVKQVNRMYEMYQLLDNYTLYFDVPVYK